MSNQSTGGTGSDDSSTNHHPFPRVIQYTLFYPSTELSSTSTPSKGIFPDTRLFSYLYRSPTRPVSFTNYIVGETLEVEEKDLSLPRSMLSNHSLIFHFFISVSSHLIRSSDLKKANTEEFSFFAKICLINGKVCKPSKEYKK